MSHRDPPPIAVWMLEHMTSGDRDEALTGDLLEVYQGGRSNGWYWHQAMAACAVSWFECLRVRTPLLVFALLWSLAAPAWNTLCTLVESDRVQNQFCSIFGTIWILPALIAWTILHSIFLWGGLLVFGVLHRNAGGTLHPNKFKRAFLLAPVIFVPAYGVLFLTVTLHWYGYFVHFQLRPSPLSQILDLRMLADVIRLPYLVALLLALWGAIPRASRIANPVVSNSSATGFDVQSDLRALPSPADSINAKRFFVLMVGAGLMNAMIAGFLICRLPESHAPTIALLCAQAGIYVLAGVLAGVGGTYLYWRNPASPFSAREPLPFGLFALVCAAGWIWVPAMVISSEQLSPATAIAATIGAFALTSGLRRVSSTVFVAKSHHASASGNGHASLFAESLYPASLDPSGYLIAICVYAGGAALFNRSYPTASVLLALAASVFAWKKTIPQNQRFDRSQEYQRAAMRLAQFAIPALLVTAWTLLDGVAHRNRLAEVTAAVTANTGNSVGRDNAGQHKDGKTAVGGSGYESVILWPYREKELPPPPLTVAGTLLAPGSTQPLIIRFNGPYWYLQPPAKTPGPMAHQATGTPLGFDIQSQNLIPLVMDAHQYLSAPIPIARCREVTVELGNRDNTAGAISLGVFLTDGTSAGKPTLSLGEQPIESAQRERFSIKTTPVFEALHFSIPANARLRRFNEITVLVLPDIEHRYEAPKIAIEQFELFPR